MAVIEQHTADDLLAHVLKALLQRNPGIDINAIEDVIAAMPTGR
jgi:acetyl-CoA acetyltransferase